MTIEIATLTARVERLEQMLLNFAAMVVGAPGELERVTATIEHRRAQEFEPAIVIDENRRMKALTKIARMIMPGGQIPHSDVARAVQGILKGRELQFLMSDLATKGELKIIKVSPDRGKPTTYYEYIARRGKPA